MTLQIEEQRDSAPHACGSGLLLHFFLTSRPYSYVDNMARALLVCAFAGISSNLRLVSESLVLSLLMWFFLNWSSDARQKDPGRFIPPRWLTWTPFLATLALAAAHGIFPLGMLAIYLATITAYPWKAIVPRLGVFGPALRGATIVAHALFILAYIIPPHIEASTFAVLFLTLTLVHMGKNLVGDIRDIQTDHYELPARFGFRAAFWTLRGTFAAAAAMVWFLLPAQRMTMGAPLVLQWAVMEVLTLLPTRQRPELVGYVGHRLYVLTFTTTELLLAYQFGASGAICWILAGAMVLLQMSYRYVPGKEYPRLSELVSAFSVRRSDSGLSQRRSDPPGMGYLADQTGFDKPNRVVRSVI